MPTLRQNHAAAVRRCTTMLLYMTTNQPPRNRPRWAAHFGCSERTITRDVGFMRDGIALGGTRLGGMGLDIELTARGYELRTDLAELWA